jgi:hypothetical protein
MVQEGAGQIKRIARAVVVGWCSRRSLAWGAAVTRRPPPCPATRPHHFALTRPSPLDATEHLIYTSSSGTGAPGPPRAVRTPIVPARDGGLRGRRPPGVILRAILHHEIAAKVHHPVAAKLHRLIDCQRG